jgi:hypothetical protein
MHTSRSWTPKVGGDHPGNDGQRVTPPDRSLFPRLQSTPNSAENSTPNNYENDSKNCLNKETILMTAALLLPHEIGPGPISRSKSCWPSNGASWS